MSLDVYLAVSGRRCRGESSGIFIREDGSIKEISREEWDRRYPDQEPATWKSEEETDEVFSANITHNLGAMAREAGIYRHVWRPEEIGITKAAQLIEPLRLALSAMREDPARFEKHNAPNGWGLYGDFVPWLERYLAACEENPDADVSVSR